MYLPKPRSNEDGKAFSSGNKAFTFLIPFVRFAENSLGSMFVNSPGENARIFSRASLAFLIIAFTFSSFALACLTSGKGSRLFILLSAAFFASISACLLARAEPDFMIRKMRRAAINIVILIKPARNLFSLNQVILIFCYMGAI